VKDWRRLKYYIVLEIVALLCEPETWIRNKGERPKFILHRWKSKEQLNNVQE
jgi:hypothetical protein